MLLGSALALAHERNLFTEQHHLVGTDTPSYSNFLLKERCERLKRVLFIYINQLTSLIGCSTAKTPFHTTMQSAIDGSHWTGDVHWDSFMNTWVSLIKLVRSSSDILFPSKTATQDILRTGRYSDLLEHFQPLLQQWLIEYEKIRGMHLTTSVSSDHFANASTLETDDSLHFDLLLIEYQYVRVHIHSLAIQAVASRQVDRKNRLNGNSVDISTQDHILLREVHGGCDRILETILKLNREGHLRYLPIRTYIQVASASVYLIKVRSIAPSVSRPKPLSRH